MSGGRQSVSLEKSHQICELEGAWGSGRQAPEATVLPELRPDTCLVRGGIWKRKERKWVSAFLHMASGLDGSRCYLESLDCVPEDLK